MKVALNVYCLVILVICGSSCSFYRTDYSRYDPRCKVWISDIKSAGWFSEYSSKYIASLSDPADRYAYYMCVNGVSGMMLLQENSFNDIPERTIEMMKKRLPGMVYDIDAWFAINIIYELHHVKYYNVAQDVIIISIMNDRCSRMKSDVKRFDCEETIQKILNSDFAR